MNNLSAIILAAGKGKRMKLKNSNKVTIVLGDKPIILHTIHLLQKISIQPIVIVVGFAKESIKELIKEDVIFAEQHKRLGTAHAVLKALEVLPKETKDVLVVYGDDTAFYKEQTIKSLLRYHLEEKNALTFLTLNVKKPTGLGRIIRDKNGKISAIVEEKDATGKQKKIKEINPGWYIFSVEFLHNYLPHVKKNPIKGEYYLTDLIDIGIKNNQKINAHNIGFTPWKGVNTKDDLVEAAKLYKKMNPHLPPG